LLPDLQDNPRGDQISTRVLTNPQFHAEASNPSSELVTRDLSARLSISKLRTLKCSSTTSMPPLRIPIDGLWRCLCPSVDTIAVSKSSRCVSLTPSNERIGRIQRRQFCGSISTQNIALPNLLPSTTDQLSSFSALRPNPEKASTTPVRGNTTPLKSRNISTSHSTSQLTYGKNWDGYTTAQLHDKLRDLPSNPGTYHEIAYEGRRRL